MDKYIKLRKETFNILDMNIILDFIFIHRYNNSNTIEKLKNILKVDPIKPNIKFSHEKGNLKIEISTQKRRKNLYLPLNKKAKIDFDEVSKKIISLTDIHRYCLLFLACCSISRIPCILQGETGSSKSFLISLFAEMLGKKLNIYQMNNDSNVSMINGQSIFEDLNPNELDELKEMVKQLNIYIKEKYTTLNIENVKKLIKKANEYIMKEEEEENNNNINEVKILKKKIMKIISPSNRFKYKHSSFCDSLENGDWILIEQIESASNEIIERLLPLTEENPEFKIIQDAKEITYKKRQNDGGGIKRDNNIKDISPDFRIFFTFNPAKSDFKINSKFLSNCIIFCLPENDSLIEYSTQISYGILRKGNLDKNISLELAKRFSQVHQLVKKKIMVEPDDFSGKMQFTQRTINFISNYFIRNLSKLKKIETNEVINLILNCLKVFYLNCYQNKMKISSMGIDLLNNFNENNQINIINEENESEEIKEINDIIKYIESYLKTNNNEFSFSFLLLVKECEKIQLNDIQKIINKCESIIKKCKVVKKEIVKKNYLEIMKITLIIKLLKEIFSFEESESDMFKTILEIDSPKIIHKTSKLIFLSKILEVERLFIPPYIYSEFNFFDDKEMNILNDLIKNIKNLIKPESKDIFNDFKNIIEFLKKNMNFFKIVNKIFPYYLIEKKEKKKY